MSENDAPSSHEIKQLAENVIDALSDGDGGDPQ